MLLVYNPNSEEFTLTASTVKKDVHNANMNRCIGPFKALGGDASDWGRILFNAIDPSCELDRLFGGGGKRFMKQNTQDWNAQDWENLSAKVTKSFKDWKAERLSGDNVKQSRASEPDAEPASVDSTAAPGRTASSDDSLKPDASEVQSTLEWRKGAASAERPLTNTKGHQSAVRPGSPTQNRSERSNNWRSGASSNVQTKPWQRSSNWWAKPADHSDTPQGL